MSNPPKLKKTRWSAASRRGRGRNNRNSPYAAICHTPRRTKPLNYLLSLEDIIRGWSGTKPQSEPITDDQVKNNAGGFVWKVDDSVRLQRFLCLGSEKGTYYAQEKPLTLENAQAIVRMISEGKGQQVLEELCTVSVEGRAAKQNPTLFCLALCARLPSLLDTTDNEQLRISLDALGKSTYEALPKVCRIPTHLFMFIQYCEGVSNKSSGWGRGLRKAVADWYIAKAPRDLVFAVTKYPSRSGWSHRDLLRLSHPKVKTEQALQWKEESRIEYIEEYADIFQFICNGFKSMKETQKKRLPTDEPPADRPPSKAIKLLEAVETAKTTTDLTKIQLLIREEGLAREHIPTKLLNNADIWKALLKKMPPTALIRTLGKMTNIGLLTEGSEETEAVCKTLRDERRLHDAKIHPFNVLLALKTYEAGRGEKGKLKWKPVPEIVSALSEAFNLSFKNVPPTGKRILLALDVSGSMGSEIMGSSISCRCASAAMALITLKTEEKVDVVGFQTELSYLPYRGHWQLSAIERHMSKLSFGGTDCSLPMTWALENKQKYDLFIVYTDNETWHGSIHPSEALVKYRTKMDLPESRLVVVGMTATDFTIADPNDRGMLDIAGFDSAAPEVIRNFAMGHI